MVKILVVANNRDGPFYIEHKNFVEGNISPLSPLLGSSFSYQLNWLYLHFNINDKTTPSLLQFMIIMEAD